MNLFEIGILDSIQNIFRCNVLDVICPIITALGDYGLFWIILSVVLICIKKTRKIGLLMIAALIINLVLCNGILKHAVNRTRPYIVNPDAPLIYKRPHDSSFPSGHTSASFSCAFVLMFEKIKYWIPAIILSAMIGFTRLYLYMHYPTDVVAGILVGLISGYLSYKLMNTIYNKCMVK